MRKEFALMYFARTLIEAKIVENFEEFLGLFSTENSLEGIQDHEITMILFDIKLKHPLLFIDNNIAKGLTE